MKALNRASVNLLFADVAATADAEPPQLKQALARLHRRGYPYPRGLEARPVGSEP